MTRTYQLVIPIIISLALPFTASAEPIDHGKLGVTEGAPVKKIIQLTTDPISIGERSDFLLGAGYRSPVQPWSPDGRWIVFASEQEGIDDNSIELAKIKSDGSSFTRLTENAVSDSNASFSADKKIYLRQAAETVVL